MNILRLTDPEQLGAEKIENFLTHNELEAIQNELDTLPFMDSHETYINKRGLTIVQNHDTFAVDLTVPDQRLMEKYQHTAAVRHKVAASIGELACQLPSLKDWEPTELSIHRYDAKEGLSYHRDNQRFIGLIAIVSLQGESDLMVRHSDATEVALPTQPGDLLLLRAPGLIEADGQEVRPEHAVRLTTPTRTSLMLRHNQWPHEKIPGFKFNNVA